MEDDDFPLRNPVVNMRLICVVAVISLVVFVCTTALAKRTDSTGCLGRPKNDTEENQPLYIRNTTSRYDFIIPINGTIFLKEKEQIILVCPNPKNKLLISDKNITTGICSGGKIKVSNEPHDFDELQCNKSIRGDVQSTNKRCGNNEGYVTNIGYYIGKRDFLTLIEVCYDPLNGNALYARHTMYGESIKHASHSSKRPAFNGEGVGREIAATVAYKNAVQKATFDKALGSAVLAERYVNRKSYLSRGHLAPDADFLFAAWQFTTYFYVNACPQWQVINGGNWEKIESMIRKTSALRRETYTITTGTHGILTLPDTTGALKQIHLLPNGKLRVPKYIWKVIYNAAKEEAVALIVLNNPFVGNITNDDYLCNSVCKPYGWYRTTWDLPQKGIVHCCPYNDFIKNVATLPPLKVHNILRGPNKT